MKKVFAVNKRKTGSEYEAQAAAWLQEQGYEIVTMNFYTRYGEIDIVAKEQKTLVFAEVKYRRNAVFGYPEDSVHPVKQQKIRRAAKYYLWKYRISEQRQIRFDVVAFYGEQIELIRDAF